MISNLDKCKIVLLNPPTATSSSEVLLNLAYLSSTLKKIGHEVIVIDATAIHRPLTEQEIEDLIVNFKPHFIGVTLTIAYIPQTYEYLKRLKKLNIPIVAGGPHVNCLPEEVLQHSVDIAVIGEGEMTISELADYFLKKITLESIAGLCIKSENEAFYYTAKRSLIKDLDTIPFPDLTFFPIKNYTGTDDPCSNPIFWSIFTSRGCPYSCIFCSSHNVFGRIYRARSAKNVFDEIMFLNSFYGAKSFALQDDEAFLEKSRLYEICELIKKSRINLRFSARARIDSLDIEILLKLKEAGFRDIRTYYHWMGLSKIAHLFFAKGTRNYLKNQAPLFSFVAVK